MPPGCLRELVFRSGNVQADCHRLMAAGVEFDSPPRARSGHPAEAVFYDPTETIRPEGRAAGSGRPAGARSKENRSSSSACWRSCGNGSPRSNHDKNPVLADVKHRPPAFLG